MHVKTPVTTERKRGVVYCIPCKDCEYVYIGETGRTLHKRISEHKYAIKRQDKNNGISVHVWSTNHVIDWESASVKMLSSRLWERRVLEAVVIR